MEINNSTIANTIYTVSSYFRLETDSEWQILKCLNNPTEEHQKKLIDTLDILISKVKPNDQSLHQVFWKTATSIFRKTKVKLSSGFERSMRSPPVTKSIQKSESPKDLRVVLKRTNLQCAVPFWFAVPELFDRIVLKVGEGSFADVYQIEKHNDEDRILKVIPIGEPIPNSEFLQLNFKEMAAEIYVSQELSKLPSGKEYSCLTFPTVYKVSVVQDVYPTAAIRAWNLYSFYNGVAEDHPCPRAYSKDQAYIVIETEMAGTPLDLFKIEKFSVALSIFKQIACGLAVAEKKLQFEHRDLHPGNILISDDYPIAAVPVVIKSRKYMIKTCSVKASIIDFTYSRITTDEGIKYIDLNDIYDPEPMSKKKFVNHKYIYAKMAEITEGNWEDFYPKTNILWLKHILACILHKMEAQKTRPSDKQEKSSKLCLEIQNQAILSYNSAFEFVLKEVL
ncbi:hypothetical protein JTE90_013604 [Oedothorax gibbosus]|uniref:non-specific serine/threonine protein kinase n=1 Tax=Oedothorax gibbosus TaxID=931172 RepID=A0AAV6VEK4_9ARAC|nr:hypothetical protein JTE90_013604 [Oedothorax gibbosus]